MKKEELIFRLAARCEAAGRPNNEDNYQVDENLTDDRWGFTADKEISLGEKGALLVVCDGMGGMNAGEVASAIAVATIKEWFDKDKLTEKILESDTSTQKYIVDAIQAADAAIKQDGKDNPEHEGMGSTIVLAWLLDKKVYVGWCGDSRAYRYNPKTGLVRLSHDHSYVQELVDAGKLTEELAFDHPNNNIITRSLGDPRGKAQPDTKVYDLCNEDIILLCSDGLCGCLRDNEIEEVIKQHQTSMQECRDALWDADEAAGWHDNVTVALAQIISGGAIATIEQASSPQAISNSKADLIRKNKLLKRILGIVVAFIVLCVAGFIGWHYVGVHDTKKDKTDNDSSVISMPLLNMEDSSIIEEEQSQEGETPKAKDIQEVSTRQKTNNEVTKKNPLQQRLDSLKKPVEKIPDVQRVPSEDQPTETTPAKREEPKVAVQQEQTLENGKQMTVVDEKENSVTVEIK